MLLVVVQLLTFISFFNPFSSFREKKGRWLALVCCLGLVKMGLRLLHLHLHGLFRSDDLELGRDSDTGGQTLYVLELARSLALRPEVDRVDVVEQERQVE